MQKDLKVLMISSDRKLLLEGSAVSERIKEYGSLVEELHVIVLSDTSHRLKNTQLDKNIWVYPTNSSASFLRPLGAARLGKKIVFDRKFIRGKSVITADSMECGWAGLKVKKKWRIPLEVQIHTDLSSPYFKGFQNSVRKFFAGKILKGADRIRVVSSIVSDKAISDFSLDKNKIFILPIYVDRERIEQAPITFDLHARYPWHFILLAVARLAPEKNLTLTLEALALAREKFPNTGLVIVGSGPEKSRLQKLVKKLGLTGVVEFVGWQNSLASFYKTANAFIQTSLFEGYGLSLVEAGLSGLPVITTPVGIATELEHGKDAYIYPLDSTRGRPAGNPELFAQAIIDLIENNQKRENLRLNLKKTLEAKLLSKDDYMLQIKDNWEKTAMQLLTGL